MNKIKILLVDDHQLLLEGIAALLDDIEFIRIVGKVSSGESAINEVSSSKPDIILMDIMMKGMSGIEAAKWIKDSNQEVKIILISSDVTEELVHLAIQAGVDGYLPKKVDKETLVEAIRTVNAGERYFSKDITDIVMDTMFKAKGNIKAAPSSDGKLSKREFEVFQQIALGKTNQEVADELFISIKTVETHKTNIMSKLDLKNTVELVKYAIKEKIIDL
ncbi:response regulator transcription factor [Fulvivirga sp.]|jgi:DNA-binding NarL/FixJ family response regulator|uniref:response regulator transcription factor n=1 Tax=Fulvivirga sp. TaxID=1931237 RepID=UPI0032ED3151